MAVLKPDSFRTMTIDDIDVSPVISQLEHKLEEYELGDYEHYMLKEIFEQPDGAAELPARPRRAARGPDRARRPRRPRPRPGQGPAVHPHRPGHRVARGPGRRLPDRGPRQGRRPSATYASEFRYRNPLVEEDTVVVAISQSGETADTLAALREAKEKGALALGVVNVVGSTIAREADGGIYLHAGPGDRRRQHQGVHLPVRRADDARPLPRPAPVHEPEPVRRR